MSLYECYASLGYENMTLKLGKFASPIGYESALGPVRDLNSTSWIHQCEPTTFSGALLNWDLTDRLSLNFGVTMGADLSFWAGNTYGFLFGAKYQWTDHFAISYEGIVGRYWGTTDQYLHSIIATWDINCRLQYVFETCYGSYSQTSSSSSSSSSGQDFFGVANYLKYQFTEKMQVIARVEWSKFDGEDDLTGLTLGFKYYFNEHLMIRPEVRYDWVESGGVKYSGSSCGVGGAIMF